ncbi:hypothetical protein CEB3_c14640 [Peptococcaceae bacterium CEB3]|nr:hypothetical protein CEB3_c14640 [Peptococcaceae bacterium CEB3]
MKLRERTQRKFMDFFEEKAQMHQGEPFELAYSEIQRETGAASVTLKRAIHALVEDQVLEVEPGRNSRYGKFHYLGQQAEQEQPAEDEEVSQDQATAGESSPAESIWADESREVLGTAEQELEGSDRKGAGQAQAKAHINADAGTSAEETSQVEQGMDAEGRAASLPEDGAKIVPAPEPAPYEAAELRKDVEELAGVTSHLWRRVRHQEATIALLQERLAELEDKIYKR